MIKLKKLKSFSKLILRYQNKSFSLSKRIKGFEHTSIWAKCTKMALATNSVNLGQGFPDWTPPEFLVEALEANFKNGNHQYTRSAGNLELTKSVAKNWSESYDRELDSVNEILVGSGGVSLLYNAITSMIDEGDEVLLIEPFYDCYLPQIQFAGGKGIGIPMVPPEKGNLKMFIINFI